MVRIFLTLILLFALAAPVEAVGVSIEMLRAMAERYQRVTGYTAISIKREVVDGALLPQERVLLKFSKPFSVYMRWLKGPHDA